MADMTMKSKPHLFLFYLLNTHTHTHSVASMHVCRVLHKSFNKWSPYFIIKLVHTLGYCPQIYLSNAHNQIFLARRMAQIIHSIVQPSILCRRHVIQTYNFKIWLLHNINLAWEKELKYNFPDHWVSLHLVKWRQFTGTI